jgi:hypothetical protein
MARSDLSGSPIEPDAKAEVLVRLADGRTRRLTLTAAEADRFADMGEPLGGLSHRLAAFAIRNWRSFALWLIGIIVASLMVPAATKQWTDGQAALTLKNSLNLEISKSVVSTVRTAQRAAGTTNEDQARKVESDAQNAWTVARSGIDPIFALYFEKEQIFEMWKDYERAMDSYIALSCCDRSREAVGYSVQDYFKEYSLPPTTRAWSIIRGSSSRDFDFILAYDSIGDQLVRQQQGALLNELKRAPARGYSTSFVDFWRDVIPGW